MKYKNEICIEGRKISINHPTYFIADLAANHDGDINRAKEVLNWEPKVSLEEGLLKTINWYREILNDKKI